MVIGEGESVFSLIVVFSAIVHVIEKPQELEVLA